MLLHLAEHLSIPLRDRNAILAAAGFAPVYGERSLNDPELAAARRAVQTILEAHEPNPALAIDRHWNMVASNRAVAPLLTGVAPALLEPPANVLRVSMHPDGVAPRIVNYREWRAHVTGRLAQQFENSGDAVLIELLEELEAYPVPPGAKPPEPGGESLAGIAVPLEIQTEAGTLTFLSTTTVFGTALEISLSELAIEAFLPANTFTAEAIRRLDGAAHDA